MPERKAVVSERRLKRAIEEVEAKISELFVESSGLRRQLRKLRAEREARPGFKPKDSAAVVERRILETLRKAPRPMSTRLLLGDARAAPLTVSEATFRLRLQGLKKRGHIETTGHRGWWRLSTPAPEPREAP